MSDSGSTVTADSQRGRARSSSRTSLLIALALVAGYMVAELIGGLVAGSLALLADAGHMLGDAAAIGLALFAMALASRPASSRRTFGLRRSEVLAALANVVGLWLIAGWILFEAADRLGRPAEPNGALMLVVGGGGLLVNLAAAWVLRSPARASLNVEGALLHVLGDLLSSIGVLIAAVLILALGWYVVDPILSLFIGTLILLGSVRLLWKVVHVLMEGTPSRLDLDGLCRRLEQVEGVTGVHDIHAWTISSGYEVLSAHVTADATGMSRADSLLQDLRLTASRDFNIAHVTIQIEGSLEECEETHHVAHVGESAP